MYVNLQIRNLLVMKIKTVVRNTLRSHGAILLVLRNICKEEDSLHYIEEQVCSEVKRDFFKE